jgi:hypothetical protein
MENSDPKDYEKLHRQLTGPFRTMGGKISREELAAPAWWHGDEEAFESAQMAMMQLPQRGRGRSE